MGHHFLEENHPFHNHFYQRRVRHVDESYNNYQMGGNIYPIGIYFVEVELGTPSQTFQVAVDSGSTDLLVPSSDCVGCHEQNTGSFDTSATSTLEDVGCFNGTLRCGSCSSSRQCQFVNSYQTCNLTDPQQICTVTGLIYSDIFGMGDLKADAIFGLINKQTKNFQQFYQINGVLGMSFDGSSSWGGQSPFEYLVQAGLVSNQFAMCMNGTSGGVLTLGKPDPSLYNGDFMYTPMVKKFGGYPFYAVNMTDILFNGISIGAPYSYYEDNGTGACVLDSGTNTILLPADIYNPFIQTFKKQFSCPNNLPGVCDGSLFDGTCYEYTASQVSQFPTFNIDVNGVQLVVPPENYLPYNGTASYQCFGVINTGSRGDLIIGDVVMQGYYVLFDRTNKQIGWADVNAKNCIGQNTKINYYNPPSSK